MLSRLFCVPTEALHARHARIRGGYRVDSRRTRLPPTSGLLQTEIPVHRMSTRAYNMVPPGLQGVSFCIPCPHALVTAVVRHENRGVLLLSGVGEQQRGRRDRGQIGLRLSSAHDHTVSGGSDSLCIVEQNKNVHTCIHFGVL